MKIALLGYGKMGKAIEEIALSRGHEISLKVTSQNAGTFDTGKLKESDVAIDFSLPSTVLANIEKCFENNVPVIVGTTGWYEKLKDVKDICEKKNQSLLYATNFSIGVNIFFKLNAELAKMMNFQPQYEVTMEEIHHTKKLDAPSGTAITLANDILYNLDRKESWVNNSTQNPNELYINSVRVDDVPGTHTIKYSSSIDTIEIQHTAHNRTGFAMGAVIAAEWIKGKKGIYQMQDVLNL